jgi:hypothetical protein
MMVFPDFIYLALIADGWMDRRLRNFAKNYLVVHGLIEANMPKNF